MECVREFLTSPNLNPLELTYLMRGSKPLHSSDSKFYNKCHIYSLGESFFVWYDITGRVSGISPAI